MDKGPNNKKILSIRNILLPFINEFIVITNKTGTTKNPMVAMINPIALSQLIPRL